MFREKRRIRVRSRFATLRRPAKGVLFFVARKHSARKTCRVSYMFDENCSEASRVLIQWSVMARCPRRASLLASRGGIRSTRPRPPTEQIYDHNMISYHIISYPHLYIYIDFNRLRTSTTATVDDAYRIRAYILESFSIRM